MTTIGEREAPTRVTRDLPTDAERLAALKRMKRVADALLGLRRTSPNVIFLGSYPRADQRAIEYHSKFDDEIFIEARDWLRGLLSGEPD